MSQELMQKILNLVHKGFVRLDKADEVTEVQNGLKALDINLLENEEQKSEEILTAKSKNASITDSVETETVCPFSNCERMLNTRRKFLLHLLMDHYEEKFLLDFTEGIH